MYSPFYYLLAEYLIINKEMSLPFIGTFSVFHKKASFDKEKRILYPPRQEIHFSKNVGFGNYGQLMYFLSQKLKIGEEKLNLELFCFIEDIINSVKSKVFVWKNIGSLRFNSEKQIVFEDEKKMWGDNKIYKSVLKEHFIEEDYQLDTEEEQKNMLYRSSDTPKEMLGMVSDDSKTDQKQFNNISVNKTYKDDTKISEPKSEINSETQPIMVEEPQSQVQLTNSSKKYKLQRSDYSYVNTLNPQPIFINSKNSTETRTEFLEPSLPSKYNTFQKIFIISVLIITILYLFFHLFLNDFSFHSFSE